MMIFITLFLVETYGTSQQQLYILNQHLDLVSDGLNLSPKNDLQSTRDRLRVFHETTLNEEQVTELRIEVHEALFDSGMTWTTIFWNDHVLNLQQQVGNAATNLGTLKIYVSEKAASRDCWKFLNFKFISR